MRQTRISINQSGRVSRSFGGHGQDGGIHGVVNGKVNGGAPKRTHNGGKIVTIFGD